MPKLSDFAIKKDQIGTMGIINPATGDPILDEATKEPWTVNLVSQDSDEFRKAQRAVANRQIRRGMGAGGVTPKVDAEMARGIQIELMVACTKGWKYLLGDDGQPIPFDAEEAKNIYKQYPWLLEQVSAFVNDRANFMGN